MIKQSIETLSITFLKKAQRLFIGLAIVSSLVTLFFALKDWDRFIESYLVAFVFTLAIPIGCLFLVMVQFLTRAGWGVAVRRIPEVMMHTFLCLAILFLPLLFGLDHLYHWFDPAHRAHDHLLEIKAPYLNSTFFYIRMVFYFLVWNLNLNWNWNWNWNWDGSWNDLRECQKLWGGLCILHRTYTTYTGGEVPPITKMQHT